MVHTETGYMNGTVRERDGFDVMALVRDARRAWHAYADYPLGRRREIITAVKRCLIPLVPDIAHAELAETGMGNVQDKIIKLMVAIEKTPGVEDLVTEASTGDNGMTLYEYSAYGVICTVLPGTNPIATLINNTIGMLAAGNAVIHIPNPRCTGVTGMVAKEIDRAICETCGIAHLVSAAQESSMEYAEEIMNHPDVAMVVATGGEKMLHHALTSAKRVIGAGAANPVVIVDETADLRQAAKCIVEGASFDNNIMCVSEKNLVVLSGAADALTGALKAEGAYYTNDPEEIRRLTEVAVNEGPVMSRRMEGRSAKEILSAAGISCGEDCRLIVAEVAITHPFFSGEFLMPIVSMIRADNFEDALGTALFIEQGNRHTAMIHSGSIDHLNRAAQVMQTSVFIKNGSSLEVIGFHGEQATSFTIANMTGEGVTTARHFARRRRCSLTSGFSIR